MDLVRQKAYRRTFELACGRLGELPLEERAAKAGVRFMKKEGVAHLSIPFFEENIELAVPGFVFKSSKGSNITLTAKIVIMHYLIQASGARVGAGLKPYEDIPGCRVYLPAFERRVVAPLLRAFGYSRDAFSAAGKALGGKAEEYGNASFTLYAFPRLPITFILWEGEEEFPPSIKVLLDQSVHTYLPLEDIVVVSKMAATRILKEARKEYIE